MDLDERWEEQPVFSIKSIRYLTFLNYEYKPTVTVVLDFPCSPPKPLLRD